MTSISYYIWLFGMVDVVIYIIIGTSIQRHIRIYHPHQWDVLGRPTFWNNSPANGIRFAKYFIFTSQYKELNDEKLHKLVLIMRVLFYLGLGSFLALAMTGPFADRTK
jgi:hypothetical protein